MTKVDTLVAIDLETSGTDVKRHAPVMTDMDRFVAIDFETSGLDVKRHAPVSLGLALFDGGKVTLEKEWIISPPKNKEGKVTREYDVVALSVSGLSWKQIKEGHSCKEVVNELHQIAKAELLTFLPVVAFNASFDLAWYSEMLFLAGEWSPQAKRFVPPSPPLVGPWNCARMLSQGKGLEVTKFSLDAVADHFGLKRKGSDHGALEDSILAGEVFCRLGGAA
jgi:DNA polymerase III epsilon subunit-like protein